MPQDFTKIIYTPKDIPKKREYLLDRFIKIYDSKEEEEIKRILDSITIVFRKQDEKGASDHTKRVVYVSFNEIKKYDIKTKEDFLKYLNDPKSVITHEITHIFQNLFSVFPDVDYLIDELGDTKIDYEKYVTDQGEIQSRVEQILELMKWGFDDNEIVEFLYNRMHKDKDLWRTLIDNAKKIKEGSRLPGVDEDEDVTNEMGRQVEKFEESKSKGKNYDRNYL